MPFNGNFTGFRSAFLIQLLQFVKEILGWRPGCSEREEKVQREKERDRDEEARGQVEGKGLVLFILAAC